MKRNSHQYWIVTTNSRIRS